MKRKSDINVDIRCGLLARIVLSVLAIGMSAFGASAQFRYGIRVGGEISTATLHGSHSEFSLKHGSGFSGGLTCEYMFNENGGFALGASLLYSHGGAMADYHNNLVRKFGNDFFDVPVHLKYKYFFKSMHELTGVFAYTGPVFRMRLDRDEQGAASGTRRLQPGWDIGLGFDAINFLQISAGYRFGLGNALHPNGDMSMRTDGVNISVAILFDI